MFEQSWNIVPVSAMAVVPLPTVVPLPAVVPFWTERRFRTFLADSLTDFAGETAGTGSAGNAGNSVGPEQNIYKFCMFYKFLGLMDYRTTKFKNDANRPSCFQQLQAVIYPKSRYFTIRLPVYL